MIENDDGILEKQKIFWDRVSVDIEKNLIASLFVTRNFLKSNIKSYGDKIRDFYNKEKIIILV